MSAYTVGDTVRVTRMDEASWAHMGEDQQEAMAGAIGRCAVVETVWPNGVLTVRGLFGEGPDDLGWGLGVDEVAPCSREDYELQRCLDRLDPHR